MTFQGCKDRTVLLLVNNSNSGRFRHCNVQQEAQLSQTDRAMLHDINDFAKLLKLI